MQNMAAVLVALAAVTMIHGRPRHISKEAFAVGFPLGVRQTRLDLATCERSRLLHPSACDLVDSLPAGLNNRKSTRRQRIEVLGLRGSSASGQPFDPNLDDATLKAAMAAADEAAEVAAAAAGGAAAADYAAAAAALAEEFGIPADSQFRAAAGSTDVGVMDDEEADAVEYASGVPGEVVLLAVDVLS